MTLIFAACLIAGLAAALAITAWDNRHPRPATVLVSRMPRRLRAACDVLLGEGSE